LAAKGLDAGHRVLAHAMAQRMIHALRQQERRGGLTKRGKERADLGRVGGAQSA
jgi:hypothetical protein